MIVHGGSGGITDMAAAGDGDWAMGQHLPMIKFLFPKTTVQ